MISPIRELDKEIIKSNADSDAISFLLWLCLKIALRTDSNVFKTLYRFAWKLPLENCVEIFPGQILKRPLERCMVILENWKQIF